MATNRKTLLASCRRLPDVGRLEQHQLKTQQVARSVEHHIRRVVYGRDVPHTPQISLLLVGETGSGKSTCVDAFVNYIYGVKFTDHFRLRITEQPTGGQRSQASSQTDWITCYSIHPVPGGILHYTLNLIDTPGFMDTRGVLQDKAIVSQMKELFKSSHDYSVDNLAGVCIVVKSDNNRLTAANRYVFDATLGLFGKDIENNIVILATHYAGSEEVLQSLQDIGINYKQHYFFNVGWMCSNSIMAQRNFKPFIDICDNFFKYVLNVMPCSLTKSAAVLEERALLQELVQNLFDLTQKHIHEIIFLKEKQSKITTEARRDISIDFPVTVDNISLTLNMNCPTCRSTCKRNVSRFEKFMEGFRKKKVQCGVCCCIMGDHLFEMKQYCSEQKRKVVSYKDLFPPGEGLNSVIADFESDRKQLEGKIEEALSKLKASIERLEAIALKPQPSAVGRYIDFVIKAERDEKSPEKKAYIEELESMKAKWQLSEQITSQIDTDSFIEMWKVNH